MKRRARQLSIDLTPLLDVILILLFLVLAATQMKTDEFMAEQEKVLAEAETSWNRQLSEKDLALREQSSRLSEAEKQLEELRDSAGMSEEEAQMYGVFNSETEKMLLRVPTDYPTSPLTLIRDDEKLTVKNAQALREYLNEISRGEGGKTVVFVFAYDDYHILL